MREEATRSVDASTCLKAALRHSSAGQGQRQGQGQQQEQIGGGGDQFTVMGTSATAAVDNTAALVEQPAERGQAPISASPRIWAGSGPITDSGGAPARKNTRGFRLR